TVSLTKSGTNYVYNAGDTYTLTVQVGGGVDLTIFGIDTGTISATLGGSAVFGPNNTVLTLYAQGCVAPLGCAAATIPSVTIPARIFPQAPPALATVIGGVLTLNVGSRANQRGISNDVIDESYKLTDLGSGQVKVEAFGLTQTYSGVSSVQGDFGSGKDVL